MASASQALQAAIYEALSTDAGVLAALGGARIYDHVPRKVNYPYITFGQTTARDWGTGNGDGEEHSISLHVWSLAAGRAEVASVVAAVRAALHDRDLSVSGHRLINLRHDFCETRREPDGERFHGLVRLRAVTEPLG